MNYHPEGIAASQRSELLESWFSFHLHVCARVLIGSKQHDRSLHVVYLKTCPGFFVGLIACAVERLGESDTVYERTTVLIHRERNACKF
jgi:hypothetical protein